MAPIIEQIQKELPDVEWRKIDIDKEPKIAESNDVMSIPTFLISRAGESKRITGQVSKKSLHEALTVWK